MQAGGRKLLLPVLLMILLLESGGIDTDIYECASFFLPNDVCVCMPEMI